MNALISFKSLDTTYLLSASDDSSIKIWNSSLDLISTKTSHSGPVTVLAYDAISKYTASGSKDRIISLYTVSLMATLKVNSAHNKKIRAICFLQDGLLASGSEDYEIKIWRYTLSKTLELITTLTEHNGSVNHLEVLSNGSLMSGSNDFTLKIWNKINDTSFVCVATLNHSLQVTSFLTLSNFIISGLVDGSIYIWNEESSIIQLLNNHTKAIVSMVALNNQSFASASVDGSIKIWRIQMQSLFVLIANLDHKSAVYSVKVLRDERLLSSGLGNWILVWQKDTFELIATLREHTNSILRLAVLESGNFISFSGDKTLVIWESNSLTKLETFRTNEEIWSVSVFPDDSLVTGTLEGSLSIWETKSIDLLFLRSLQDKNFSHSDDISALEFIRPKDNILLLLSGSNDKTIKVWDTQIYQNIVTLTGHTAKITALISINQKTFASSSSDKTIKIWDYYSDQFKRTFKNVESISQDLESLLELAVLNETRLVSTSVDRYIRIFKKSIDIKQINEMKGHSKSVQDIAVLAENLFASCSGDHTIKIWNNSIVIQSLEGHSDYVYALVYAKTETLLISGSKDTTIRLWDSESFTHKATMYYHEDSVNSLLVLPNKVLASGSCDNKIIIWNLNTFEVKLLLKGHQGCVNALIFYNSNKLISGSADQMIIIWDISNNFKLTEMLRSHCGSINSLIIHQEKIVSASSDKSIKIWSKYELSIEESAAHSQGIKSICILNDGLIVTGSFDYTIKIWKPNNQTLDLIQTIKAHYGNIFSLNCENQSFISASDDLTVKLWKKNRRNYFESEATFNNNNPVISSSVLKSFIICGDSIGKIHILNKSSLITVDSLRGHIGPIWFLVSLSSQKFASSSEDKTIKIWKQERNNSSFECIRTLTEHTSRVYALVVLKNIYLISGCHEGLIKIWHLVDFSLIQTLKEHTLAITGLAVLENGNFISISDDKTIVIWNGSSLAKIKSLVDYNKVWSVSALSNGLFVIGNSLGDLKIWSYSQEYKPVKTLIDHQDKVLALTILNGAFLISASQDGNIIVWDDNFQPKVMKAHSNAVLALNILSRSTLISSSEDKTIKIWNAQQFILEKKIF